MFIILSDGELVMKPRHSTSMITIFVIQTFFLPYSH